MSKAIWGLERLELFKDLNAMELQEIVKIVKKVRYASGDVITDGEERDIFILVDGQVDIVSLNDVPLYRVVGGETFGELALLSTLKRTARAVCRNESWVIVMSIGHLEKLGEAYPEIYRKVSENIVRSLGVKLARANKLIELLKAELSKALKNR